MSLGHMAYAARYVNHTKMTLVLARSQELQRKPRSATTLRSAREAAVHGCTDAGYRWNSWGKLTWFQCACCAQTTPALNTCLRPDSQWDPGPRCNVATRMQLAWKCPVRWNINALTWPTNEICQKSRPRSRALQFARMIHARRDIRQRVVWPWERTQRLTVLPFSHCRDPRGPKPKSMHHKDSCVCLTQHR